STSGKCARKLTAALVPTARSSSLELDAVNHHLRALYPPPRVANFPAPRRQCAAERTSFTARLTAASSRRPLLPPTQPSALTANPELQILVICRILSPSNCMTYT